MQESTDFQIASIEFLKVVGDYVRLVDYIRGVVKFDDDSIATYNSGTWQILLPNGTKRTEKSPLRVLSLLS